MAGFVTEYHLSFADTDHLVEILKKFAHGSLHDMCKKA